MTANIIGTATASSTPDDVKTFVVIWRFSGIGDSGLKDIYLLTLTPQTALLMIVLYELEILSLIFFLRLFQRLFS